MNLTFGTDGVRGVANEALRPEEAMHVGFAAGNWIVGQDLPRSVVIGRDSRRSGPMLGAALASGFCSAGIDVTSVGMVPTGGVSWLVRNGKHSMGAVISASHNPAQDNGIKLFASGGDKAEASTERFVESYVAGPQRPTGADIGRLMTDPGLVEGYFEWLLELLPEGLDGQTVVVDGANGAASAIGPQLFRALGADVVELNCAPDGDNINRGCGATHPEVVQEATRSRGATFGVAFDGDADRAVFADSQGRLINGDRTMAVWSAHWKNRMQPKVLVGTVMSNGGFEAFMRGQGIELKRTDVGDKYVSAELNKCGGKLGGEQSGHLIFTEHGPTGDGLVTALEFARVLKREDRSAEEVFGDYEAWPQALVNVQIKDKQGWNERPAIQSALNQAEGRLAECGRVSLRASGTQPILRIMVEADSAEERDDVIDMLVKTVLDELGGQIYSKVDLTHALGD